MGDLGMAVAHLRDLADTLKQWSVLRSDMREVLAALATAQHRLTELEPCLADAQSTAARLLIEREQYAQTLRNTEERAQFAVERADAAEAERDHWHQEYRELFDEIKVEREEHGQELGHLGQQVRDANARATSLAALEAAARALVVGCPVGDPLPLNVSPLVYDLHRAVAALVASPGEIT